MRARKGENAFHLLIANYSQRILCTKGCNLRSRMVVLTPFEKLARLRRWTGPHCPKNDKPSLPTWSAHYVKQTAVIDAVLDYYPCYRIATDGRAEP